MLFLHHIFLVQAVCIHSTHVLELLKRANHAQAFYNYLNFVVPINKKKYYSIDCLKIACQNAGVPFLYQLKGMETAYWSILSQLILQNLF